jgi:hypothetical protein
MGRKLQYGRIPLWRSSNLFFKQIIDTLPTGKILLPADGEGRNGVYAQQGDGV